MTIFLEPLIERVRLGLAAAPQEMIDDPQVYQALKDSQLFVTKIIGGNTVAEDYLKTCIVNLGVYYSYANYVGLATRQLDNVPTAAAILMDTYRSIALAFLQPISVYPLNPDLTIDMSASSRMRGLAFSLGLSNIEDDT